MITLELIRYHSPYATMGEFYIPDLSPIYTLEPPWLDNKPFVSCSPSGTYLMTSVVHDRFGRTWVMDIPERTGMFWHTGNKVKHTKGCILPGLRTSNDHTIIDSRKAMELMRSVLLDPVYRLHITHYVPEYKT